MTASLGASALDDEFTALAHVQSVRQFRVQVLVALAGLMLVAAEVWLGLKKAMVGLSLVTLGAFVVLVLIGSVYPAWMRPTTWRPATRRLLTQQPWRETAVRVLNTRGTKLYLAGGGYVKVNALPPAVREIVVRAGRVWLVGPDARGRLAIRVPGLLRAWPARRIPPVQGSAALPTGEPIMRILLRPVTRSGQSVAYAAIAFGAVLQMIASILPPARNWVPFFIAVVTLVCAVAGSVSTRRLWRLYSTHHANDPWIRAGAAVSSWRVRWNGFVAGTVVLTLPDGRVLIAHLNRAPLDLFANVRQENALWIAGDHEVGFPHYGIVAFARLAPAT